MNTPKVSVRPRAGKPTTRHLSDVDLGLDRIRALRGEAGDAGDREQVALCDAALAGDQAALARCFRVLGAAEAMLDNGPATLRSVGGAR